MRPLVQALESIWALHPGAVFFEDGTNPEGSGVPAQNRAVERLIEAGWEWMFWHSADDIADPNILIHLTKAANENPRSEILYPMIEVIDDRDEHLFWWGSEFDPSKIYDIGQIPGIALVHTDIWKRAGGYPNVPYGPDWGMYALAYHAQPFEATFVPEAIYRWRKHDQSESAQAENDRSRYQPLNDLLNRLEA